MGMYFVQREIPKYEAQALAKVFLNALDDRIGMPAMGAFVVAILDQSECSFFIKRVQKHFGKRLRFVLRNFPLNEIHPHAESAAETAEFAGAHGKFWEMHDLLFESKNRLGGELFQELAKRLKLASADLLAALEKREFLAKVRADFAGGARSGVNGTPTFFINGRRDDDPFEYADLVAAIEAVLQSK